jgi:hypothetical protein
MKQSPEGRDDSITRRKFLRQYGLASGALTLSPFFMERFANYCRAATPLTRVYKVKNGDCFQNIAKLWDMMGGVGRYISPTDIVVIKANAQWKNQGYTHTGCIKAVIDAVLAIPGFSGEVLLCDNIQYYGTLPQFAGQTGFVAGPDDRQNNWPDHNYNSLAASYRPPYQDKPVAIVSWQNGQSWAVPPYLPYYSAWNPANGQGWHRYFFNHAPTGKNSWISCPVFPSPLTSGRLIDLKNGVWDNGVLTGRRVRTICMPTLNNHTDPGGQGSCSDTGITSAIKCFYGISEIPGGVLGTINGYSHIHSAALVSSWDGTCVMQGDVVPTYVGQLVGTFLQQLFSPVVYITSAIYSGWKSRTGVNDAVNTNTVLACENPVTLDYVSARDVISPHAAWLNPDQDTPTRRQILGCNGQGIGTVDPQQFEVVSYDFNHPTASRLDVERKIRDFRANKVTEQEVRDTIKLYMNGG